MLDDRRKAASQYLRARLREATAEQHDTLDTLIGEKFGWTTCEQYAAFLSMQLAARSPVERWLDKTTNVNLAPPRQCHLIADDLRSLLNGRDEIETVQFEQSFLPPPVVSASQADQQAVVLGTAWTLAGSALGNRSILKDLQRNSTRHAGFTRHCAFLASRDMLDFWAVFRRQIERPATEREVRVSSQAASAVFNHFLVTARLFDAMEFGSNLHLQKDQAHSVVQPADQPRCPVTHP